MRSRQIGKLNALVPISAKAVTRGDLCDFVVSRTGATLVSPPAVALFTTIQDLRLRLESAKEPKEVRIIDGVQKTAAIREELGENVSDGTRCGFTVSFKP